MKGLIVFLGGLIAIIHGEESCADGSNCKDAAQVCTSGVNCIQGFCQYDGSCKCEACYTGKDCSQYVDPHPPIFSKHEDEVVLSPKSRGIVYTVQVIDQDGNGCLESDICLCAKHHFTLASNDFLASGFVIDSSSGDVSLRDGSLLSNGDVLSLQIIVTGRVDSGTPSEDGYDQMILVVTIQEEAAPLSQENSVNEIFPGNYLELDREKRSAIGAAVSTMKMVMVSLNDPPNVDGKLYPGNSIDFELTITLPEVPTNGTGLPSFNVEVFVMDPVSGYTPFTLCSVAIKSIGSALRNYYQTPLQVSDVIIDLQPNSFIPLYTDRATFDFLTLYNTATYTQGATDFTDSEIIISFTAVLVRNTLYTNATAQVTSGISYSYMSFLWVAQANYTYLMEPAVIYPSSISVTGPSTLNQWTGGYYELSAGLTTFADYLCIEVFTPSTMQHDKFSVTSIQILSIGSNLECSTLKTVQFVPSVTGRTYHNGNMTMSLVTKNLEYANLAAQSTNATNTLKIGINIFIHSGTTGEIVTVGFGINIGIATIWNTLINVTVAAGSDVPLAGAPLSVTSSPVSSTEVYTNGTATWGIKATLPAGANALIDCTATVPADHKLCGVIWGTSGYYVSYFPSLENLVQYADDGSATWTVNINSSVVDASLTRDSIMDFVIMEVSVLYSSTPDAVTVTCAGTALTLTATTKTGNASKVLSGTISVLGDSKTWYPGSQAGYLVTLKVPTTGLVYSPAMMETFGDLSATTYGSRVCDVKIMKVGKGVPCMASVQQNLFTNKTTLMKSSTNSLHLDGTEVDLGSLCSSERTVGAGDNEVTIRFVYDIFKNYSTASGQFNLTAGILLASHLIWTGWVNYIVTPGVPAADTSQVPYFTQINPSLTYGVNSPIVFKYYLKVHPGTVDSYKLTATAGANAYICKILIMNIGENFACLDQDPYGKETDPAQGVTIVHDAINWGASAVLNLGIVRNLGSGNVTCFSVPDRDAIEIGVVAKGLAAGTASLTMGLVSASLTTTLSGTATISTGAVQSTSSVSIATFAADGSLNAYEDSMEVVTIVVTVPDWYDKPLIVIIQNDLPDTMSLCTAFVSKAGKNLPCVIPVAVGAVESVGTSGELLYTFDFSTTCYQPNEPGQIEENKITIIVGVGIVAGVASASFKVRVIENLVEAPPTVVTITNAGLTPLPATIDSTGFDIIIDNGTVAVQPGWRIWVGATFKFPLGKALPLKVSVITNSSAGHSFATVHGFRWANRTGDQAKIVGCLLPYDRYTTTFHQNSSVDSIPMYHSSQNDAMISDLLYITNIGSSSMTVAKNPVTSQALFEADIWIADHDLAIDGDSIVVGFVVQIGTQFFSNYKNFTFTNTGAYVMDLNQTLLINADTSIPFDQFVKIPVTVRMWHNVNTSQIEAYNAIVRFLMPSYIAFADSTEAPLATGVVNDSYTSNITCSLANNHYLDFNIGYLFFTDVLEINLTVTVNPYFTMPMGLGLLNATILSRFVCSKGTHDTSVLTYCSPTQYVDYQVNGMECFDDLNVTTFSACQFSASTAIDQTVGPDLAPTTGWSPAVTGYSKWVHYITIDFLKLTRVTKIEFFPITGKRAVATYKLQTSVSGDIFKDVCSDVLSASVPVLPSTCRTTGRFFRIVIKSTSNVDETTAIGVKLKPYGCSMASTSDVCKPLNTIFTDQVGSWRHFAYDSTNGIIYFCDYVESKEKMGCFSSLDGSTWNVLPSYIASIAGYDAASQRMYVWDRKKSSMLSSSDGVIWSLVDTATAASVLATMTPPTLIPGVEKSSFVPITLSTWQADFDGLLLGGLYKMKWSSCCS